MLLPGILAALWCRGHLHAAVSVLLVCCFITAEKGEVATAKGAVSGSLSSYVWVQEGSDEVLTLFTRFCRGAAWLCLLGHRG